MRIVIIGGGKVGGFLAKQLREAGHTITVIEKDESNAEELAAEADVLCLLGDGTDVALLRRADTQRADYLLALTGRDEDNLVACQLARTAFGTPRVLARLNDPRNRRTFDALKVPVVGFTDLVANVISKELDVGELARVALLDRGDVSLLEIVIPDESPPREVASLTLPPSSILVAVRREGTVLVPGPETTIQPGDRILAVTRTETEERVRDALLTVSAESNGKENGNTALLEGEGIEIVATPEGEAGIPGDEDG
ncbi:MAG: TrkA family potassium uptake protein [Acidimicrobiia bacterium]|nr:TrkA family potassium uptake protein [Acidimicrobiia bacterium]